MTPLYLRTDRLQPGDVIIMEPLSADLPRWGVFIGQIVTHPVYPELSLVVWRLANGTYSFDALPLKQEIPGRLLRQTPQQQRRTQCWALGQHGFDPPIVE